MKIDARPARRALALASSAFALLLLAPAASADVGVERVLPPAARPGDSVLVQLGCGFCFPPCVGPRGERRPKGYAHGACMLGVRIDPPPGFPISLVAAGTALAPRKCRSGGLCAPEAGQPPQAPPFHALGVAQPPPRGNDPASGRPPRYLLRFRVPQLDPGAYSFVVYCAVCNRGRGGSLVPSGRLLVRSAEPQATIPSLLWSWLASLLAQLSV